MIKDHISIDMVFSKKWVIPSLKPTNFEIIKNGEDENNVLMSFVSKMVEESVNEIISNIDRIIDNNLEREEKEKLFKLKVQELRGLFENQNLDHLKSLKFDIDELATIINNSNDESREPERSRESIEDIQIGEDKE